MSPSLFSNSSAVVKLYDFKTPDRFTKEQLKTLEMLHEDLATRLSNSLPAYLRANVSLRVVHSEQGLFRDFLADWSSQTLYHLLSFAPLEGQAALVGNEQANQTILAQLLGGQPPVKNTHPRGNTAIDVALLNDFCENLLNDWRTTFSRLSTLEPKIKDHTTNQHWVQLSLGNEWVALFVLELTIKKTTGALYFYYPYNQFKPLLSRLTPKLFLCNAKESLPDITARATMLENLLPTTVQVKAVLGQSKLSIKDVSQLQIGSVITLAKKVTQPVTLQVNGRDRFQGVVQRSPKGKLLIVVNQKIQEPLS